MGEKQNITLFRNIFFTILAVSTNNFFKGNPITVHGTQYTYIVHTTNHVNV